MSDDAPTNRDSTTGAPDGATTGAPGGATTGASDGDLPEAVSRRLAEGSFSSGLTVPDFAACLQMGMTPVGLVQGFCVMQWGWTGSGAMLAAGLPGYNAGGYSTTWNCPHGFVSAEHRTWGQNYEQPWVEQAWSTGFGSAYQRLVEEAQAAGAHGVIGVVDTTRALADMGVTEFHIIGTAIRVEGTDTPAVPWTTYLAGARLAKLIEAGFMPVSIAAAFASVRVWAYCVTELLMRGQQASWATYAAPEEINQLSEAHMSARRLAREKIRHQLGSDTLHGARLQASEREMGEGDQIIDVTLRGTRVRRFKDFDPMVRPRPTVRLS